MSWPKRILDALLINVGYPLVLISAIGIHGYTMVAAFKLADPGPTQYIAAMAAFVLFPISEVVVAYYAWRASHSMINGYSVWLLLWLLLVLAVALLMMIEKRLARKSG